MTKDIVVFDWEVFPHWNCMVYNIYNGTDNIEFGVITSDDENYVTELRRISKLGYLVGFNIKGYDMQIFNFACMGYTPEELYIHNQKIINSNDGKWKDLSFWRKYEFSDLFDDLKTMGSLKQFESNTGLLIKESDIPFGKENLSEEDKKEIIEYCKHDVFATNKLVGARWGYLNAKANCSRLSDLNEAECIKNTAAKVCAKMLHAKQKENLNDPYYEIPEKLKPLFKSKIHPTIIAQFEGTELSNDFSYEVRYLKNNFVYGAGGIHSTYEDSLYSISDGDYILVNADFENLYPSLLVVYNYYASGIPEEGKERFQFLLSECRRLKKHLKEMRKQGLSNTDEYKEAFGLRDSIKLILNASTGAMRQEHSPLYDPQNIIALCMTGQLLTTCMAKIVFDLGALVIQTNTDGILFRIKRNKLQDCYRALQEFSEYIEIPLDIDEEYAVFQKNVNNYILLSEPNAKPKLKGRWAKKSGSDVPLTPLNAPVINDSIIDYYCKNIPIEDTVRKRMKPLDFMMTTMKGPTYDGVLYASENGEIDTTNINRVYATINKSRGTLYKYKIQDGKIIKHDKIASIPDNCTLYNDAVTDKTNLIDIDYDWYIRAAKKNAVEMKRLI
jgi:hypothetical protein